jgi:protoporphyrinogen/coproporphyrinogen III oxidase
MPFDPQRIVIVGGGLSGLSLAFRLRKRMPAARVTVIEKGSRPGGHIGTIARDGFRVETGPNGIFDAKPSTIQLCRDLGLGDRLISASEGSRKNRYLFLNGKLRPLPGSLWSFVSSSVLSWRAKFAILTEKYRRRPADLSEDESVAAFARRRAGKEVANVLADAAVTGIHAADPELLSVAAAFPRLVQFEREHGSVMRGFSAAARERRRDAVARGETPRPPQMWSFHEGLEVLVDALREQLGTSLVAGVGIRRIERTPGGWAVRGEGREGWDADALVLATRAHEQADLVEESDPTLATEMRAIPYNRIAVVALGFRRTDIPRLDLDGFGYIAPQNTRRDVLGVQWCSSIYPDRAPPGMVLWRALCGGWHRGEMVDWPEDRLVEAVRRELHLAMGVAAAPAFVHVTRFPAAIPQYLVGHLERVKRIEARVAALPGLFVGGNAYHGVAMSDCTEQAVVLAERVAAHLAR